jgi:hypothetical protein
MVALLTVNALLLDHGPFYRLSFTLQVLMYGAGALALLWNRLLSLKPFKLAGFFLLGNLATIAAWFKFCLGEKFVAWQPTHRG